VEYAELIEHVRQDESRLAAAAQGNLSLSNDVPSCPGWTVRDLVRHLAEVYEHKIECTRLNRAPDPWPPAWPSDRDPIEWLDDAHGRLQEMFERSRPSTPSATWWPPDQTVGFWARRMAHETAVHRVDAELATGMAAPTVEPDLAVDGIDEILDLMLAGDWSEEPHAESTGQRVAVATAGGTWLITLEPASVTVSRGGDRSDARIEGDPSSVLLWLWGRAPDERIERSGDLDAIRVLRSRLVIATQ
jgi:uncharacterized protein (TIGR03083 family)